MAQRLTVLLRGDPVGEVRRETDGRLAFRYDAVYRFRRDATPLSLSMPLVLADHRHDAVHAFLSGLLPDNERVIERWGQRFHVPVQPFDLLGSPVGADCPGAVQFTPADESRRPVAEDDVEWLSERDVASKLRELRRDTTAWLPDRELSTQFSLAGAQAKTALFHDPESDRWGRPRGRVPTSHILKPAIYGLDDHDLNEHLCMSAAGRVGLRVARTSVRQFDDTTALVVERYDRAWVNNRLQRVHQEDLCQALAVPPVSKYQNDGGPSPEQIVALLHSQVTPSAQATAEVWRFVDALMFNWLIAGTDAHAKNYSVLLERSQVRLAPLYDIASALPYDDVRGLSLAMKIGGTYRLRKISVHNWRALAGALGLDEDAVVRRGAEIGARLPAAMEAAATAPDVVALDSTFPQRLVDVVGEHATRCVRYMR